MIVRYKLDTWYQFDSAKISSWFNTAITGDLTFYEFTQGLPFKVVGINNDGTVERIERKSDGQCMDADADLGQWCILNSLDMTSLDEINCTDDENDHTIAEQLHDRTIAEQLHDLSIKAKIEIIEKLLLEIKTAL